MPWVRQAEHTKTSDWKWDIDFNLSHIPKFGELMFHFSIQSAQWSYANYIENGGAITAGGDSYQFGNSDGITFYQHSTNGYGAWNWTGTKYQNSGADGFLHCFFFFSDGTNTKTMHYHHATQGTTSATAVPQYTSTVGYRYNVDSTVPLDGLSFRGGEPANGSYGAFICDDSSQGY